MSHVSHHGSPTVLILEVPGRKPMGSSTAMLVASHGWQVISLSSPEQALATLQSTPQLGAFVCNDPNLELFESARSRNDDCTTVLVTELPMHEYSKSLALNDVQLIDHVVANLDPEWTASDLAITLRKILLKDLFGIEKYLNPDSKIQSHTVKGSADRETLNRAVLDWVDSCGVGKISLASLTASPKSF